MLLCTARVLSTDAETLFTSAVSVTSLEELYAGHKRFQPLRRLYFLYYMYPYLFYRNACPTHSGHGTKLRHCVSLSQPHSSTWAAWAAASRSPCA